MEPNGILIYGELNEDYSVNNVVLELLTKARELKEKYCFISNNNRNVYYLIYSG